MAKCLPGGFAYSLSNFGYFGAGAVSIPEVSGGPPPFSLGMKDVFLSGILNMLEALRISAISEEKIVVCNAIFHSI